MIFNSRKPREIKIDEVVFTVTPLDCYQQLEFGELVDAMIEDPKKLPECVKFIFENLIKDFSNLVDESGENIDKTDMTSDEFVRGFSIGYLGELVNQVIALSKVSPIEKKN